MTGVQILKRVFDGSTFPTLFVVVEIAWGADLTAADSTWTWTDVTADVLLGDNQNISMTLGRGDEASQPQPAGCSFALTNSGNKYGLSALATNWPNVRRGTPIRIRAILNSVSHTRFEGFVVGFTPGFNTRGNVATTAVTAAGVLRRLKQGSAVLASTMRSSIPSLPNLAAYWPLEEGSTATQAASGLPTGLPMQVMSGTPTFGATSPFASAASLVTLKNAWLLGYLNPRVTGSQVKVTFMGQFPASASASPDASVVLRIHTTGSIIRWDLLYRTGGNYQLTGYDSSGQVYASGSINFGLDGLAARWSVQLVQSGSDIAAQISALAPGGSAGYSNLTVTGQSITGCYAVAFSPAGDQTNLAVGHLYVESVASDIFSLASQLTGYDNEAAGDRFTRLCAEQGVPAATSGSLSTGMGPQSVGKFLDTIQECATANFGVIVDGLSAGLTFFDRTTQENEAAAMTLDATAGDIVAPFAPVDDDQVLVNQWTVTQKNGSSAVSQDTDGPLGVDTVGLYDSSTTLNLHSSSPLQLLADWLVHQTTVEGYRYPAFGLAFHTSPALLASWLGASLLSRIDVTKAASVAPQVPDRDIRMLVQGYTEVIDQFTWSAALNTSPYDPWRLAVVAAETGDTGEFLFRAAPDEWDGAAGVTGAAVTTDVAAGVSSISVTTRTGPLWTTVADDFPLYVEIGGIRVKVTNITGGSSPQTFTVDATTVTKALTHGSGVDLWEQTVLSI